MVFAKVEYELINMLSQQDIGCHYGPYFCGVLGYADDIVLLSPSPCGLRCQLTTCETFASSFNLTFNSSKSQLICFSKVKNSIPLNSFTFNGEHLQAVSSVTHLGHRYTQTLDNFDDIQLATSDILLHPATHHHVSSVSSSETAVLKSIRQLVSTFIVQQIL